MVLGLVGFGDRWGFSWCLCIVLFIEGVMMILIVVKFMIFKGVFGKGVLVVDKVVVG